MKHEMDDWIAGQWMGRLVRHESGRVSKVIQTVWDDRGALNCKTEDGHWSPAVSLDPQQLYLSFEQSAVLHDAGLVPDSDLDTGYVTVADGDLYDGPGASNVGQILAVVGPFPMKDAERSVRQVYSVLKLVGANIREQ